MYDALLNLHKKETIYIAGPECFYTNGYTLWDAMRRKAEYYGFSVAMPNDNQLDLSDTDLQGNARKIYQNCANSIRKSTAILVDLESFRGSEPDSGSIFELGMAYAIGMRCYAYSRDKRSLVWKHQGLALKNGVVCDADGRKLPYADLPFATCIVGACKVMEGSFDDCLNLYMMDLEEAYKAQALGETKKVIPAPEEKTKYRPLVYLAGPERYDREGVNLYNEMKKVCAQSGLDAVTPMDRLDGEPPMDPENPYNEAAILFHRYQQHVRDCDAVLANLNDFRGYEPSNDVAFECGMATQLGKKVFGYMADTTRMCERIPNYGPTREFRDACGCNAENFAYPINLMYSGSMPIWEGGFESAVRRLEKELRT